MAFIEPMHRNKPNITYLLTCKQSHREADYAHGVHVFPAIAGETCGYSVAILKYSISSCVVEWCIYTGKNMPTTSPRPIRICPPIPSGKNRLEACTLHKCKILSELLCNVTTPTGK